MSTQTFLNALEAIEIRHPEITELALSYGVSVYAVSNEYWFVREVARRLVTGPKPLEGPAH